MTPPVFGRCMRCAARTVVWTEETFLAHQPDWWPEGVPYEPVRSHVTHSLCLVCGRHEEELHG